MSDPKEGRFCGYAEAVAGNEKVRRGIARVLGLADWNEAQATYRQLLYGTGTEAREPKHAISGDDFQRVLREGGRLPLAEVLRCRVRYFSDGAVLGSKAFVAVQLARYGQRSGRLQGAEPIAVPALTDWGELTTLRSLRRNTIG